MLPAVIRLERRAAHIQPGLPEIETGVEQSVEAPLLDGRQRIRGQVGQCLFAKFLELVVLHIHADRQLKGLSGQRSFEHHTGDKTACLDRIPVDTSLQTSIMGNIISVLSIFVGDISSYFSAYLAGRVVDANCFTWTHIHIQICSATANQFN